MRKKVIAKKLLIKNSSTFVCILLFCNLICNTGKPYESYGIRSIALGESLTGATQTNDSLYNNPAAMSFTNAYILEGGYVGYGRILTASILDTKTASFGGVLGYINRSQDVAEYREQVDHIFKLAYSKAISDFIAVGLGGSYLIRKIANGDRQDTWNLDTGLILVPHPVIQGGIAFRNMLQDKAQIQTQILTFGVSLHYWDRLFGFYSAERLLNLKNGNKAFNHSFGVEGVFEYGIMVRGGILVDQTFSKNYWSLGFAWASTSLGINYAFRNTLSGPQDPIHAFSITLLF